MTYEEIRDWAEEKMKAEAYEQFVKIEMQNNIIKCQSVNTRAEIELALELSPDVEYDKILETEHYLRKIKDLESEIESLKKLSDLKKEHLCQKLEQVQKQTQRVTQELREMRNIH